MSGGTATGGEFFDQLQLDWSGHAGFEMDGLRLADEVPGRHGEILALPLIHVGPDRMAIGAVELGVNVQEDLHDIIPRRQVAQAALRIAGDAVLQHDALAGLGAEHILAKQTPVVQARLRLVGVGDEKEYTPGQSRCFVYSRQRDFKAGLRLLRSHARLSTIGGERGNEDGTGCQQPDEGPFQYSPQATT